MTYKPYGRRAILIEWPPEIEENILVDILNFKKMLLERDIKVIVDVINTYSSITVFYSLTIENIYNEFSVLKSIYKEGCSSKIVKKTIWKIPVCYDVTFGIDLKEMAIKNDIEMETLIHLHSKVVYTIYFIGFLPGFLYLGGLDSKLHIGRKNNPRLRVEKGAVGIGGSQTGVYPQESAGGWNIIGNSPVDFFDRKSEQPCFAIAGDLIQFVPVDLNEYHEIKKLVSYKRYKIEREVIDA